MVGPFATEAVTTSEGFDLVFGLLDREFGPRGEMEPRTVLEGWFTGGPRSTPVAGVWASWRAVVARHGDVVVGVRDVYLVASPPSPMALAFLSHTLVMPAWRGRGVAGALRGAARGLAEAFAREVGVAAPRPVLFGEMEPFDPDDPATSTRLRAYGRAGFAAIDPAGFPYLQPDFSGGDRPVPLVAITQGWTGSTREEAWTLLRWAHAVHRTWCRAEAIDAIEAHVTASPGPFGGLPLAPPFTGLGREAMRPWYPSAWWR